MVELQQYKKCNKLLLHVSSTVEVKFSFSNQFLEYIHAIELGQFVTEDKST